MGEILVESMQSLMATDARNDTYKFCSNMINNKTVIPWMDKDVWAQVELSISKTISVLSADSESQSETANLRTLAQQIVQRYAELETILERACLSSCPTCADVCCSRATVWYDLKDLLTIYLSTGALPLKQIYRRPDQSCCNLTPSGCRLTRAERPFICTWYICPEQNKVLEELFDGNRGLDVFRALNEIKIARNNLELAYVDASFG